MSQEVIHRPLNAEARVTSQGVPLGICSEKSGTGIGFLPVLQVFPFTFYLTSASCLFIRYRCSLTYHLPLKPTGYFYSFVSPAVFCFSSQIRKCYSSGKCTVHVEISSQSECGNTATVYHAKKVAVLV